LASQRKKNRRTPNDGAESFDVQPVRRTRLECCPSEEPYPTKGNGQIKKCPASHHSQETSTAQPIRQGRRCSTDIGIQMLSAIDGQEHEDGMSQATWPSLCRLRKDRAIPTA
jgi:hypothetical protein